MTRTIGDPLPVQLLAPWIADNENFQQHLTARSAALRDVDALRRKLTIRQACDAPRCLLDAVDACQVPVEFGDQLSILVQGARIHDDGSADFSAPCRTTGINGHAFRMAGMPMRLAEEARLLAASITPTIADMSYWSVLMDVNQAIGRAEDGNNAETKKAVNLLVDDGLFKAMIINPNVIPMSKLSESDTLFPGVSDRQILTMILQPGEYTAPRLLSASGTSFKIERRGFMSGEQSLLQDIYDKHLSVLFYKPHAWTRAFRIEAHANRVSDESWLMPLLAAIKHHTIDRAIYEPWPQFLVDYTVRRVAGVAPLYGEQNWHRHPGMNYVQARTRLSLRS